MSELKPKDFCDMYLKACQYIMPKAGGSLSAAGSNDTLVLEETKRKATIIRNGLPTEEVEPVE